MSSMDHMDLMKAMIRYADVTVLPILVKRRRKDSE